MLKWNVFISRRKWASCVLPANTSSPQGTNCLTIWRPAATPPHSLPALLTAPRAEVKKKRRTDNARASLCWRSLTQQEHRKHRLEESQEISSKEKLSKPDWKIEHVKPRPARFSSEKSSRLKCVQPESLIRPLSVSFLERLYWWWRCSLLSMMFVQPWNNLPKLLESSNKEYSN